MSRDIVGFLDASFSSAKLTAQLENDKASERIYDDLEDFSNLYCAAESRSAAELAFMMVSEWFFTHWLMDTLAL